MRPRWLQIASAAVLLAGVVAVVLHGDEHVGPAACARRVTHALEYEVAADPTVQVHGTGWIATVPSTRVIVRVEGDGHRVTGVQALAGPGADLLERPQKLIGLAVRC